ncbi:BlaI/MecI/CopY family transcriptional regulator [Frankia sp. Mgl5]|nr:BlaI/MecI/CopY family transcriptional regulator [Frankia sp. Mgl5]
MRLVWTTQVPAPFVVRDVATLMPELADTTVMTVLRQLTIKGLLAAHAKPGRRAHEYRAAHTPGQFLVWASNRETIDMVARYGQAALGAFAIRLAEMPPNNATGWKSCTGEHPDTGHRAAPKPHRRSSAEAS